MPCYLDCIGQVNIHLDVEKVIDRIQDISELKQFELCLFEVFLEQGIVRLAFNVHVPPIYEVRYLDGRIGPREL